MTYYARYSKGPMTMDVPKTPTQAAQPGDLVLEPWTPPVTRRAAPTTVMVIPGMARPSRKGVTVEVDLGKQTGHSPLWNGAGRGAPRWMCPELRSTGCGHQDMSNVIWSQTGSSGAPKLLTTNLAAVDPLSLIHISEPTRPY